MERMILLGCGGHGKSVADAAIAQGQYKIAGFVGQENDAGFTYRGHALLGTKENLPMILADGIKQAFLAIGYLGRGRIRNELHARLVETGFSLAVIADPTAIVAADAEVAPGVFIGKRAVVNACATIEASAILNTGAIVEHDCRVGAFSHVAVGAVLCGNVQIGTDVLVGAGAVVLEGRRVGAGAIIGAGAVVRQDVPAGACILGVPGRAASLGEAGS